MQYKRVKGHGDTDQMGEGHVAKGGTIQWHGKSCFPHLTLVFVQTVASKPSSTVQTPPIHACCCKSFFPFFPFHLNLSAVMLSSPPPPHLALTQAISPWHHLDTTITAPTLWLLQLLPLPPFVGSQAPAGLTLTCVVGTHKPPRRHHPHCA